MPELPEVETLRRRLAEHLVGRTIERVDVRLPKIIRPAGGLPPEAIAGESVLAVRRRAKTMVWDLSGDLAVVLHLKLSGQIVLEEADGFRPVVGGHPVPRYDAPLPHKATHVIFHLTGGGHLFFTDIRQFGYVRFLTAGQAAEHLAALDLGPEPLEDAFTWSAFQPLIARRPKSFLKPLLLDQSFVSGLGNIYADEALHVARLHPLRRAGDLSRTEQKRLFLAIRDVLQTAVDEGVADFEDDAALEARGFPRVHGRAGRPCHGCTRAILRIRVGTRSTYFCPRCQRERASRSTG